jgi:hypothetical protein
MAIVNTKSNAPWSRFLPMSMERKQQCLWEHVTYVTFYTMIPAVSWYDTCSIMITVIVPSNYKTKIILWDIYVTRQVYSHSGTTLSKMLECLVNFTAKCKLCEFAIGFCHSKKCIMWQYFFLIGPMSDQNYFCSDIVRCPTVICSPGPLLRIHLDRMELTQSNITQASYSPEYITPTQQISLKNQLKLFGFTL